MLLSCLYEVYQLASYYEQDQTCLYEVYQLASYYEQDQTQTFASSRRRTVPSISKESVITKSLISRL